MLLTCNSDQASTLGELQLGRGTRADATFPISIGKAYEVAGMVLWETMLWLLVRDDDGDPLNAPAGLFERVPASLPEGWKFKVGEGATLSGSALWEGPLVAVWGYAELVENRDHLGDLFEGDAIARGHFDAQFETHD